MALQICLQAAEHIFPLFLTSHACKEGSSGARPEGWLSWCPIPRPVAKSNLCRGGLETGKEAMLVMGSDASRVGAIKRLASSPLRCKWRGRRRLIIKDQMLTRWCWVCGVSGPLRIFFSSCFDGNVDYRQGKLVCTLFINDKL